MGSEGQAYQALAFQRWRTSPTDPLRYLQPWYILNRYPPATLPKCKFKWKGERHISGGSMTSLTWCIRVSELVGCYILFYGCSGV